MTDQNVHPDAARYGGWDWQAPAHGEHFRRCSFCSSVHPEDLAAEPVWSADWADRKYGWPHKFYVDIPNRDPGALFVVGSARGQGGAAISRARWVAVADLTAGQRAIAERDGYLGPDIGHDPDFLAFGTRAVHFGKFYSIHLSDADLPKGVKPAIEQRAGITFEFSHGRVTWGAPSR